MLIAANVSHDDLLPILAVEDHLASFGFRPNKHRSHICPASILQHRFATLQSFEARHSYALGRIGIEDKFFPVNDASRFKPATASSVTARSERVSSQGGDQCQDSHKPDCSGSAI